MATDGRADPIRVVEAGYAWTADEAAWLGTVVQSCKPYDVGGGVVGFTVRAGAKTEIVNMHSNADDRAARALGELIASFPPAFAREALAPTEFVGNAGHRLARLAKAALPHASRKKPSAWALVCGDVRTRALVVCFPRRDLAPDEPFPHADSRTLGLAGAHLGSALRLRALAAPAAEDADTEAVLSPAGKLLHAAGAATEPRARDSLTHAVLASERARTRTRAMPRDEALREWTALVHGRWTIIETVERDGKRLVLARRNRMQSVDLLDLSQDERDVVWLAALGHSYKYIAYELGIPISTVSGRLRRAMRKLRVDSRAELLRRLGTEREK